LRAFYFALRGIWVHRLFLRASALAYVTLLSLIPMLALAFAAANGLGLAPDFVTSAESESSRRVPKYRQPAAAPATRSPGFEALASSPTLAAGGGNLSSTSATAEPSFLTSQTLPLQAQADAAPALDAAPSSQSIAQMLPKEKDLPQRLWDAFVTGLTADQVEVSSRIEAYVRDTKFAKLKAAGIILLIIATVSALGAMEEAFNRIWHVHHPRPLLRKFADYLSVVVVCPILMAATIASGATTLSTWLSTSAFASQFYRFGFLNEMVGFALQYASLVSVWLALTFLYWFMPNTRVQLRCALGGALCAAIIWHLSFWLYTKSMASMSAVYAALAALPIFLTWLYFSWVIVLLGAEVAAAYQNRELYERELMVGAISPAERLRLGLNLLLAICARFRREAPPWSAEQLARYLDCPIGQADEILDHLADSGILTRVGEEKCPSYQPAVPLTNISPARVIEALQEGLGPDACGNATPEAISARSLVEQWRAGLWRELGDVNFESLVEELQKGKRPALPAPVAEVCLR
jgi:membrane protein